MTPTIARNSTVRLPTKTALTTAAVFFHTTARIGFGQVGIIEQGDHSLLFTRTDAAAELLNRLVDYAVNVDHVEDVKVSDEPQSLIDHMMFDWDAARNERVTGLVSTMSKKVD